MANFIKRNRRLGVQIASKNIIPKESKLMNTDSVELKVIKNNNLFFKIILN